MFFFSNEIAADKRYNQIIPLKISCKNLVILRCWQFRQLGRLQQKPFVTSQNRGKLINTQRFFTNLYLKLLTIFFFFFYKKQLLIACSTRSEGEYSQQKNEQEKTAKSVGVGREGRQSSPSLTVPLPPYFFSPLRLGHSQLLTYSRCFCNFVDVIVAETPL